MGALVYLHCADRSGSLLDGGGAYRQELGGRGRGRGEILELDLWPMQHVFAVKSLAPITSGRSTSALVRFLGVAYFSLCDSLLAYP